jgi:hypothetical protein
MFHEQRIYEAQPAKLPVLVQRFVEVNVRLFERHGFKPLGYWTEEVGAPHRLVYLLAWDSWEDREQAWAGFYGDSEWARSLDKYGPTVERITSSILKPMAFSPLR